MRHRDGRLALGSFCRCMLDAIAPLREPEQRVVHPLRPRSWDEVPIAARPALADVSPGLAADRLFVVPPGLMPRRAFWQPRRRTPAMVLAFAEDAVVLWSEDEGGATLETLPIGDVLAVDDRTVLLYGRLRVIGRRGSIVVQYNAAARDDLRDNVLWLRRRIAGEQMPAADAFVWRSSRGASPSPVGLPYKWSYMLAHSPNLRLDPGEPAAVAAGDVFEIGDVPRRGRTKAAPSGLALLGSRELVIAAEPAEHLEIDRYGVDLIAVPRRFVRHLSWEDGVLRIELCGGDGAPADSIVRPLDRHLADAMRIGFGDAVAWA